MQKWISSFIYLLRMFGFFRYQAKVSFVQSKCIDEKRFTNPYIVIHVDVGNRDIFIKNLGGFVIQWSPKVGRSLYKKFMSEFLSQLKGLTETHRCLIMNYTSPVVVVFCMKRKVHADVVKDTMHELPKLLSGVSEDKRIVNLGASVKLVNFVRNSPMFSMLDIADKIKCQGRSLNTLPGFRRRHLGLSLDQLDSIKSAIDTIQTIEDVFEIMEV